MTKNYRKNLAPEEPPKELFGNIMKRIHKEERLLTLRKRLAVASFILLSSGVLLFPAFKAVQSSMVESGFAEFLSLIFYDLKSVIVFWQSFSLALLESLPATSLAGFLAVLLVFLGALRFVARDMKDVFRSAKLKLI